MLRKSKKRNFRVNFYSKKYNFRDAKFSLKIKRFSLSILGVKESRSSHNKAIAIGWRFVFIGLFFLYLSTGFSPIDILRKSIKALNGKTDIINLYATNCYSDNLEENYRQGWWNEKNSAKQPNVISEGDFIDFTDKNSAFYSGGESSLICSGFKFLQINKSKKISEAETETETVEDVLEEENEVLENDFKEKDEPAIADIESEFDGVDVAGEETEETVAETVAEIELEESQEIDEAEEMEITEPVKIVEPEESGSEEFSLFEKAKSLFGGLVAHAEEYIANEIVGLNDLGEFKEATINFSFAFSKLNQIKQPVINSTSDESEEVEEEAQEEIQEIQEENIVENEITEEIVTEDLEVEEETIEIIDILEEEMAEVEISETAEEVGLEENTQVEEVEIILEEEVELVEKAEPIETVENNETVEPKESNSEEISLQDLFNIFLAKEAIAQTSGEIKNVKLVIWYSVAKQNNKEGLDEEVKLWQKLDTLTADNMSNALNGGYFSYNADFLESWDDIENLEIKIEGVVNDEIKFVAFLDSVWVEAVYEPGENMKKIIKRQAHEEAFEFLSSQTVFKINEEGEFKYRYTKNENKLWDSFTEIIGLASYWKDVNISAIIESAEGEILNLPLVMIFEEDGEFTVRLPELPRDFKPGEYKIKFKIEDDSGSEKEVFEIEQDFSWGVLAINTNKSIYTAEDDSAWLQMAVLDDEGRTLCDADLTLEIISPEGLISNFYTADSSIISNEECGANNIIDTPDYYAFYMLYGEGTYKLKLTASTTNGVKEIFDEFEVKESVSFEVERIGPTRIYPMADYNMTLNIKADEEYSGEIIDYLPESFQIVNQSVKIKKASSSEFVLYNDQIASGSEALIYREEIINGELEISWQNIDLEVDDELEITYLFDAPNVSPELFLLGPLEIGDFSEARAWQIASDLVANPDVTSLTNVGWINDGASWDNTNDTWARRDILKQTGSSPETTLYLEANDNDSTDLGGDITQVEIGIEGAVENTTVTAYLLPKFTATTTGTAQPVTGATLGTSDGTYDSDVLHYVDITNDTARPNYPNPWTWAEIKNLDVRVYGGNSSNSQNRFLYIDEIYIRVNYDPNSPPTASIITATQKKDDSGAVDIYFSADDADDDNEVRAKVEYVAGSDCSSMLKSTLDETDVNATSTYGSPDPKIENDNDYQIGNASGWIQTSLGANTVSFDWLSEANIPSADGTYCVGITTYDGDDVQATIATTTVVIDNVAPTAPGTLTASGTTKSAVTLEFGATSTESHFTEYRIYYATSTPVTEADYLHSSSTDANLGDIDFNDVATTSIEGLEENTEYFFTIWAYDEYGHKASSSAVAITTNKAPLGKFNSVAQKSDGTGIVDIEVDVDDFNNDNCVAKIEYVQGADCDFLSPLDPTLDETQANIDSTYGLLKIDDSEVYQVGSTSGMILTPATNTLQFDWQAIIDESTADDTYCLRLTVNDGKDNQNNPATTTVVLDNTDPDIPGNLTSGGVSTSTVKLTFGATTTETNFLYYKIFYKAGTSGVDEDDTEQVDSDLNNILFNDTSSTTVTGLNSNTDYVFNIWAYDNYGNVASATEISIKTDATIQNESLTLTNPAAANYVVADDITEWNFQAEVREGEGWQSIDYVLLRLADDEDSITPFTDLEFRWDQGTDVFSETGADNLDALVLADTSTSTCAGNVCTLDFNLVFNKSFATTSINYTAEIYSVNDSAVADFDSYANFYQARLTFVKQIHYRWRNDDGGE